MVIFFNFFKKLFVFDILFLLEMFWRNKIVSKFCLFQIAFSIELNLWVILSSLWVLNWGIWMKIKMNFWYLQHLFLRNLYAIFFILFVYFYLIFKNYPLCPLLICNSMGFSFFLIFFLIVLYILDFLHWFY